MHLIYMHLFNDVMLAQHCYYSYSYNYPHPVTTGRWVLLLDTTDVGPSMVAGLV